MDDITDMNRAHEPGAAARLLHSTDNTDTDTDTDAIDNDATLSATPRRQRVGKQLRDSFGGREKRHRPWTFVSKRLTKQPSSPLQRFYLPSIRDKANLEKYPSKLKL